jgi:hypothetical protein
VRENRGETWEGKIVSWRGRGREGEEGGGEEERRKGEEGEGKGGRGSHVIFTAETFSIVIFTTERRNNHVLHCHFLRHKR